MKSRLCCSSEEVNTDIFSENNKLYPKMTYLPLKISKDDGLSHKLCDKCKCKVLDYHIFCLLILEAQNTLQTLMQEAVSAERQISAAEGSDPLMVINKIEIIDEPVTEDEPEIFLESVPQTCDLKMEYNPLDDFSPKQDNVCPSGKTTEMLNSKVIQAPAKHSQVRSMTPTGPSIKKKKINDSNTDDEGIHTLSNDTPLLRSLLEGKCRQEFKPIGRPTRRKPRKLRDEPNKSNQKVHKKKAKLQSARTTSSERDTEEDEEETAEQEGSTYECCVCLAKADTKKDLLQHYREHLNVSKAPAEPNVPPFPEEDPEENRAKCSRCRQVLLSE
ncbi:hypothetical protein K1T71_013420 [Dendrolimus kikuchii]|uniref:Uncharacterized protein n=1 Tax=Dendrolimus kikuchii TaxID=765133 RepID=A0ACC1CI21_9NEOP|nr:hypothetical protein K1T71_013420 [Dendrolimus kikuchii]